MNRTIILLLVLVAVVGAAVGMTLYLRSASTPTPTQQSTTTSPSASLPSVPSPSDSGSKDAVQAAYKSAIAAYTNDNVQLYNTVISGGYAIQVWQGNTTGGEALLKFNTTTSRWVLVTANGGIWTLDGLVNVEGVPKDIATVLLAGVPH